MIEQNFRVLKNRWRILKQMPLYDIKGQGNVVVASCVLHNFIRIYDKENVRFLISERNLDNLGSNAGAIVVKKT